MESVAMSLVISNAHEHSFADRGYIDSAEVHRVILTNVSWIRDNMFVLINETMRQRLGLDFDKTLPPQYLRPWAENILLSRGPYRTCEHLYLSTDPISYKLKSISYPALVPNLPVDFVLGTMFFDELELCWNSRRNGLITRQEEEEEARRQTYRNIL